MEIIQINNLNKAYSSDFSLKNINLSIESGKIFALLGPNGAGKTTLVKLILNLLHQDSGEIKINNIDSHQADARSGIAFVPEKFSFHSYYTAQGVLEFFGTMKGLAGDDLQHQIEYAMKELNIVELKNRKLSTMSKGQVQRIGLASLLIGDNQLLILDEPFSGLDPIGMRDLKELLKKEKAKGKTIFLNSHILSEMEQICDNVAILNKGEMKYCGTLKNVMDHNKNLEEYFYKLVQEN